MVEITIILTRNIPFFISLSNDSSAEVKDLIRRKDNIARIKNHIIKKLNDAIKPEDFEIGAFFENGGPLRDESMRLSDFRSEKGYFQIIPKNPADKNFEMQDLLCDARKQFKAIKSKEISKNGEVNLERKLKNEALRRAREMKEELEAVKERCHLEEITFRVFYGRR